MSQDTNVENLIINKLTKAQYESIATPDPTQLYFITDEVISSADVISALGYTPYNATNPDGFISSAAIASLTDVALTGLADGQVLKYNSTTQKWENSAAGGGGTWGSITGTLSNQTDLQTALNGKQATLVSGTNIKTLNGNSILGSGDLTLDGLPSQTGQSGKFLTTDGTDASWGNLPIATASTVGVVKPDNASIRVSNDGTISAICRNVGEIISSTLPLTDAGLHLLDGSLLQYGVYKEFIDYIANLYAENPSANYFTTEALWQTSVTTYGVCGKFVYDSANNTVRLPKVTGIIEGTTDVSALGDLVEAGLPTMNSSGAHTHTRGTMNITGSFQNSGSSRGFEGASGAFSGDYATGNPIYTGSGNYWLAKTISLNASSNWTGETSSNGNHSHTFSGISTSSTVQPQTIKVLYYIVIANSTKTDIQVDIDNVVTDLNDKVGKNGDSVNGTYYATTDGTVLVVNNTNITDSTGTPTVSTYSGIQFNDANNVRYGKLEGSWSTDGTTRFGFNACRNVNGSNVYAQVNAWVDANGNTYFNFPKCTTNATTTSSASDRKVAVVTQNYVNGSSWYRVYSDGWCEQGGFNANNGGTVTLLKKMKNNTYTCLCCHNGSNAKGEGVIHAYNKTTTSFNAGLSISASGMYGYSWYVSGYIA